MVKENSGIEGVRNKRSKSKMTKEVKSCDECIDATGDRELCGPNGACYRYIVLLAICLCGVGDYFCLDNPAALESNILRDLDLTETEYMGFYSFSQWPSAVMCLVSGFLIDRVLGVRLGIGLFSWVVSIGQVLFATGAFVNKYWMMCLGRIMFSLAGAPFSLSTQKLTTKWFQGREITMAFGLRVSVARVGSVVNMNIMQPIYKWFSRYFHGYQNLGMALYVGVIICVMSFLAGLGVCFLDKKADSQLETTSKQKKSQPMRLSDIRSFPVTFWLCALLTSFYYLALFPFVSLGPVFFEMKYDKDVQMAGNINSMPYMVSLASPLFGIVIDKTGRNLLWLFSGIILSLGAHVLFAFTFINPYIPVIILGVGYTIVTAVVWPIVAYVVKGDHVGTAYGIMNAVISVSQGGVAYLTGYLADTMGYLTLEVFFLACICGSSIMWVLLYLGDKLRGGILMMGSEDLTLYIQEESKRQDVTPDGNETKNNV